jgi:hypothetical protein
MTMSPIGIQLGAPGVYRAVVAAVPRFEPVRLDIAGFVGVAPRGPVDEPVTVRSWTEYQWRFGGAAGPGLLGLAVQSFFAQGGERAVVLRVGSRDPTGDDGTVARTRLRLAPARPAGDDYPPVALLARDEGTWGNGLEVRLDFDVAAHAVVSPLAGGTGRELVLPRAVGASRDVLLRVRGTRQDAAGYFRWVEEVRTQDLDGVRREVAVLDGPLQDPSASVDVDVITGRITATDRAADLPREEIFAGLALGADSPAALQHVLDASSMLVKLAPGFPARIRPPDELLTPLLSVVESGGEDRYALIGPDSFFGLDDVGLLPTGGYEPVEDTAPFVGVDRIALEQSIGLLCVPDLLWREPVESPPMTVAFPARAAGPGFAPCPDEPAVVTHQPGRQDVALLDGGTELDEILRRQARVVALAERQRRFVALLDVPMRLPVRSIARWRTSIDSSYAAAYHPWLGVLPADTAGDRAAALRLAPPSALAAGIIAERERRLGIPWGPANVVGVGALIAADPVSEADANALHLMDVNVFRPTTEGFRLAAAHTLTLDQQYRQLSVRRLMTMLRLVLDRQSQWLAFEPDEQRLRTLLRAGIVQLLRDLFRAGAFRGNSEDEAFFVQCDDALNPEFSQRLGRLVAEVGVAPSVPLEYIVLRITRRTDSGLMVEG